jgi:Flp pilus assembly protein CpaB
MKGITGIIIAVALAITGGVCNWLYIQKQAESYRRVGFVKVISSDSIRIGDQFKPDDFEEVKFPEAYLGKLETVAVRWSDVDSVIGQRATREYVKDQLVLHEDLRTPPARPLNELLGKDEREMTLPIDSRMFNPAHVNPGDEVSFWFPRVERGPEAVGSAENPVPTNQEEIIGPFRLLAIGNRRGSRDVQKAAGHRAGSESSIGISFSMEKDGQPEPRAIRLKQLFAMTNGKGVHILLHPKARP